MKESADDIKEFRINRNKTFRCSKRRKVYQYSKKKYQQAKKAGLWKPALLFGILIVIFVSFRLLGITDYIFTAQDKVESLGIWAPVIFILIFIVLIVLVVPGSAITIACGLLFPLPLSLIVDSIASTIGATIAFLISRYVAREPLRRFLSRYPWFSKMEQISYHRGALLVVFIRITPPIPFNFANYAFGLTNVKFRTYVFWTWLSILLPISIYLFGMKAITDAFLKGGINLPIIIALVLLVIALISLIVFLKKKLSDFNDDNDKKSDNEEEEEDSTSDEEKPDSTSARNSKKK